MAEKTKNRILIIEDEIDVIGVYKEVLVEAGYNVDEAKDGDSGMQKIKEGNWDILLLDIMLPGKDGLKILKEMKEDPSLKKGPIVALTNLNSDSIIQDAYGYGVEGYLVKSEFTPDKVVDEVAKVLGKEETQ